MVTFKSPELETGAQETTLLSLQTAIADVQTAVENLDVSGPAVSPVGLASYAAGTNLLYGAGGQSNLVGNTNAGTYSGDPITRSQIWNETAGAFELINIGTNYRDTNSPLLHMAAKLERDYPDINFFFVDEALGATGFLREAGDEHGYGQWAKGRDLRRTLTGKLSNAIEAMQGAGDWRFGGFIWIQGERAAADFAYAEGYEAALEDWFDEIRSLTNYAAPIYAVRLNIDTASVYPFMDIVRSAQEDSGARIIDVDDIPLFTDNIHYTAASYRTLGERLATSVENEDTVLFGASAAAPPARTRIDIDALQAIPGDWTNVGITENPQPGFVILAGGNADGLGNSYVASPVLPFEKPIEIGFISVNGDFGVGLSNDPALWSARVARDSLVLVKNDTDTDLYYGETVIKSFPLLVNNVSYKARFTPIDEDDLLFELLEDISGTWTVIGFHVVTNGYNTVVPRAFYDAAVGNPRATFVNSEDYKEDLNIQTVRFAQKSDGASEAITLAQYQVLDALVTELKTTSELWTFVEWLWFPVGPTLRPAQRCIKHPNGSGYQMAQDGPNYFVDADWNGLTLTPPSTSHALRVGVSVASVNADNNHLMAASDTAGQTLTSRFVAGALTTAYNLQSTAEGFEFFSFSAAEGAVDQAAADTDGVIVGSKLDGSIRVNRNTTQLGLTTTSGDDQVPSQEDLLIFRDSRHALSAASGGRGFPSPGVINAYVTAILNAQTARAAA